MSIIWPVDTRRYRITQRYGEHPEWYKKFNLAGHNGIDIGCPIVTILQSPIEGVVVEVDFDPEGYGWYVKIENAAEGALVAHMSQVDVQIGFVVEQGQRLGLSGNTGNSTGPHVHFGYYRIPRNRSNGYNGYIDPEPYFLAIGGTNMTGDPVYVNTAGLNTYNLDDTNIQSKQVVYDLYADVVLKGLYMKREEANRLIAEADTKRQIAEGQVAEVKKITDEKFKVLADLEELGFKTIEEVKAVVLPYREMYQAGYTSLESVKTALDEAAKLAQTSAGNVTAIAGRYEELVTKFNKLKDENDILKGEVATIKQKFAGFDPNSMYNKIAQVLEAVVTWVKNRKTAQSNLEPVSQETNKKLFSVWSQFNQVMGITNTK